MMPERTITIQGTGEAAARPDEIHILLELSAQRPEYSETMALHAAQYDRLVDALARVGIGKEELKTTGFQVDTIYDSQRNADGSYQNRFVGYRCTHNLRLAIPMDTKWLGEVLSAIAQSDTEPELSLRFTVHDPQALQDQVLRSAAENARHRAELLAKVSGVRLGMPLKIEYNWSGAAPYSPVTVQPRLAKAMAMELDIEPEEVKITETVTFTWALV